MSDESKTSAGAAPVALKNAAGEDARVLVTGVSGYIGAHVARVLLERGYRVRGTTRSLKNTEKVAALKGLVPGAKHPLELAELDLLDAESWKAAVKGCDYVQHIASPFIIGDINEEEMIRTAVEGTLNVLKACAATNGAVKHVVFTSSVVSIAEGHKYVKNRVFTEADWSNPESDSIGPYPKSKVLAERAAWDFQKKLPAEQRFLLSCVNPAFVFGPPLLKQSSASIDHISSFFKGAYPMIPDILYGVVDVRDVAMMHVLAMEKPEADGQRFIASGCNAGMRAVAHTLAGVFNTPKYGYKITTKHLPYAVMWLASWFDKSAASSIGRVGKTEKFDSSKAQRELGIAFRPLQETLADMGFALIRLGIIEDKSKNSVLSSGAAPSPVATRGAGGATSGAGGAGAGTAASK